MPKELTKSQKRRIDSMTGATGPTGYAGNLSAAPTPEFIPWIKTSVEDKLERLRFVVKDMMKELNSVQKKADKVNTNFFNHKHVGEQLVQIMSQFGDQLSIQPEDKRPEEEKWF
jgi:phosphotransferase system IIB component